MFRFLEWFSEFFVQCGGMYLVAGLFLLLASVLHRRPRVILCVLAWLTILTEAWGLFIIIGVEGLAHNYPANNTFDVNVTRIGGTLLVVAIAGFWSYRLFRKPKGETIQSGTSHDTTAS